MTRWYKEKKREHFYKEAKRAGYRARSSYKLKQIQKKFSIIKKGDIVIDFGAAPGGWSQVTKELVEDQGAIIGIDLSHIEPLEGVTFLQRDLTEKTAVEDIRMIIGNNNVDVILSDMSPDISGNYSIDHARSIYLCEHSLSLVKQILKPGVRIVKQFSPIASRKSSSEVYIVAKSYIR